MKAASLLRVAGIKLKSLKPILETTDSKYWSQDAQRQLIQGNVDEAIKSLALCKYKQEQENDSKVPVH